MPYQPILIYRNMFFKRKELPKKKLKQQRRIVLSSKNKFDIKNAIKMAKITRLFKAYEETNKK